VEIRIIQEIEMKVVALAEVVMLPNTQILILPSMLNIHNHVERICYFEYRLRESK